MTFTMPQFPLLSYEQSNPSLATQNYLAGLTKSQADARQSQLQNALTQIKLRYADPQEQASLALAQAQPKEVLARTGLLNNQAQWVGPQAQASIAQAMAAAQQSKAQAGLIGANTNLVRGQTPYLIQQEQAKLFSDPIIQRQYQLQLAQQQNPQLLQRLQNLGITPALQNQGQIPFQQINVPPSSQPGMPGLGSQSNQMGASPTTAPKMFGGDAAQNYALFGMPYNPIQMEQLKAQAKASGLQDVSQINERMKEAQEDAQAAATQQSSLGQFSNNYDKANFKGAQFGKLDPSGKYLPVIAQLSGKDLSAEQLADAASGNLALDRLKGFARATNMELGAISKTKPSREMDATAKQEAVSLYQSILTRTMEKPAFIAAATQAGIDSHTQDALWNLYNKKMPVYNSKVGMPNSAFQGQWQQLLNPEIVQAVKQGKDINIGGEGDYSGLSKADLMQLRQKARGRLSR